MTRRHLPLAALFAVTLFAACSGSSSKTPAAATATSSVTPTPEPLPAVIVNKTPT